MESQTQSYLHKLLTESGLYTLSQGEKNAIEKSGIESFVYAKLTSKKFRKFKMTESSVTHTKQALQKHIVSAKPIQIVYPQGGYKLWRFPSSPEADWAEFFNIAYVLEYLAPIAEAYKPGVVLTYYHHTLLMEIHGNLTKEEIAAYGISFDKVLQAFQQSLPENITVNILKDADLYSRDEYFAELEEQKSLVEKEYETYTDEQKEMLANMAKMNIKWDGNQDWTKLSKSEREEKVYQASLYEKAATMLKKVGEKVKSPDNILLFNKAAGNFIGIGTTKGSIAKYWVGYGVLRKKEQGFFPIILTPKQYEEAIKQSAETINIKLLDGKNFSSIMVFESSFTIA